MDLLYKLLFPDVIDARQAENSQIQSVHNGMLLGVFAEYKIATKQMLHFS